MQYMKKDGHVATITMNRPERLNAVHPPAAEELSEIWDDALADDNTWVIVLTGAGEKAFSAGNDLKYTAEHGFPKKRAKGGFGGLTDRTDIWKPTIAAVNGFALGGGFEMALACDIIVAADHARLGLPEPRVGLAAAAGGVHRLPRQMPLKIALGYMLTGKHMTAQEAHGWGVVNEVVPLADLKATVKRWTDEIQECAPLSVRATKQCATLGAGLTLDEAFTPVLPGSQADDEFRRRGRRATGIYRKAQTPIGRAGRGWGRRSEGLEVRGSCQREKNLLPQSGVPNPASPTPTPCAYAMRRPTKPVWRIMPPICRGLKKGGLNSCER